MHRRGEVRPGKPSSTTGPRRSDDFSIDMIKEAAAEEGNWMHPRQVLRELEKAMPEPG